MKSSVMLALRLILKKFTMHGILIVQTTITVLLFAIILGRMQQIREAADITGTFSGQNAYYFMRYQYVDPIFNVADALHQLDVGSFSIGEIGNLGFRYQIDKVISAYGYNDTISDSCSLRLAGGVWFAEYYGGNVPAITVGDKYSIGEILNVSNSSDNKGYSIEVIGSIDADAYVISFNKSASSGASTVEHLIAYPRYELILPYSSNKYNCIDKTSNPDLVMMENSLATLIVFEGSYPHEYITDALSQYGHSTNISDMLSNFDEAVRFEMMIYSVVCLVFTLLTLVGLGGNNGIQNMLNEHQYVIYFMLGATQKKCVWIETVRASFIIISSFILAVMISFFFPAIIPAASLNASNWAIIFAYLVLVFFLTSGVFLYRLGKKNLVATYKERA